MQEYRYEVAGEQVTVRRVQTREDLEAFRSFVRSNLRCLAVDSETTGLDIYASGFGVRLVQFGTPWEAYVLPVEHGEAFADDARKALRGIQHLVLHNAGFDLQAFARRLNIPMEDLWPKVTDTRVLAHLVDPRGQGEGGVGHSLEALTGHYVSTEISENVKGLMANLAKEWSTTKAKIWSAVPSDHPKYSFYAGMDTILASRLYSILHPKVPASSRELISFEHEIAEVCSYMEQTGFLLDVDYSRDLSERLKADEHAYVEIAKYHGCESVNSTEQVADVLEQQGVRIPDRTPTGKRKVDKKLLDRLTEEGNEFARAVTEAKRARKWRETWVDGFLANRGEDGRCHPSINALRARTARMSITGIPAQTLPSGDYMIRRCFLADEGHAISSVDYQAQELRVLAYLAGDKTMIQAFKEGWDLHLMTAQAAFGDHVTKDSKERKIAKTVNFGRVYGGGAKTVSEQTGIDKDTAKTVVEAFDKRYPGVARLSQRLQTQAIRHGYITTPSGRRLPVDSEKPYSALNYLVQSTSRDVTCRGLIRLHRAGFTPYLRLPVHDEVVASLPADKAGWGAEKIAGLMAEDMGPVHIGTDPEVGKRSWGSLYGAEV